MKLIDIGVNLTSKQFRHDVDDVIGRARDVGVARMVVTGTSLSTSHASRELAATRPGTLWSTAGVHPHNARELDADRLAELEALSRQPEVVCVGECGLDYNRNFSPPDKQREAFEWQLELAARVQKPVFLHERDAHDDFLRILGNAKAELRGMVVHCFTGTLAHAEAYLELGAHIGITGWICDERRGHHLAEVVRAVPVERLLMETDAPFLLPRDLRPKPKSRRNEPCQLPHIAAAIARHRGEPTEQLAEQCWRNATRIFGLDAATAPEQ
jgi:TatD DNase family protein